MLGSGMGSILGGFRRKLSCSRGPFADARPGKTSGRFTDAAAQHDAARGRPSA